jgi:hypothetical protein
LIEKKEEQETSGTPFVLTQDFYALTYMSYLIDADQDLDRRN